MSASEKMRVYIAAWFGSRDRLKSIRKELSELGYEVTSRWMDEQAVATPDGEHWVVIGAHDLADVERSDLLIVDTLDATPRGGRECEVGYHLRSGKPFLVVGQPRHPFHHLALARFQTWDACVTYMRGLSNGR